MALLAATTAALINLCRESDLGIRMCEFKVYLDGERVMEDVVVATVGEDAVTLRDVIGDSRTFEGVRLAEVNVPATRLVLERV